MSVIAALRREERKWKDQLSEAQQQLDTIAAAMKLWTGKATGKKTRRKTSAATRKKMAASAKKRWAAKKQQ